MTLRIQLINWCNLVVPDRKLINNIITYIPFEKKLLSMRVRVIHFRLFFTLTSLSKLIKICIIFNLSIQHISFYSFKMPTKTILICIE